MRRSWLARGSLLGLVAAFAVPAVASADTLDAANNGVLPETVAINSLWVIIAGCFVMFMQAGFAFLEIGFSRGKNVGTVVAKILTNFSIAALMYWAVDFAFAFGVGDIIGHDGFFLRDYGDPLKAFPVDVVEVRRDDRIEVVLPVRVLRGVASPSWGTTLRISWTH